MNETIAIDFRPGEGIVPTILTLFDREGYVLHGIRLVPSCSRDRATLRVDVDLEPTGANQRPIESELAAIDAVIEVIHRARTAAAR